MKGLFKLGTLGFLFSFAMIGPGNGQAQQQEDLRKEIEALKKGQRQMLKDVDEIKKLLQGLTRRASGPNVRDVVLDIGDNPFLGENTASLTLVEFTDYQ